jgi:hypothetical protein
MSDYNFDLGSFDDLAAVDMANLADMDVGNLDLGDIDLGGLDLNGLDLGGLDLGSLADLGNIGDIDLGSIADLGNIGDIDLGGGGIDALLSGAGMDDLFRNEQGFEDLIQRFTGEEGGGPLPFNESEYGKDLDRPNLENQNFDLEKASQAEYQRYLDSLTSENAGLELGAGSGSQNFGSSVDMDRSMSDFDTNLTDIMQNRGGFTSQWQQVGTDRVMISDDGTGIGINENGDSYALSKAQVDQMVKNKQLNTKESGYVSATGGKGNVPGGGLNLGGGKYLTTDGKTIYTDKDGNLTTKPPGGNDGKTGKDGKDGGTKTGGGGGGGGTTKDNGLGALLPLLLMMMMMNRDKGGGGSGATIPALTASQKQTPYMQQQRAPGYRPGQGGITYFEPTQFTPKMAAGGGIGSLDRGRLLQGPGDGVSDSIPAVIDGGMAGGGQPAKVARGEYIFDARSVAALGNGSTDAGAERLDKMRENILRDDRKAGVGEDSKAYRHLMA